MNRLQQSIGIFLFISIISVPVILPYFHTGYFPTHDGEWAVVRVSDMFRSLRDHQFPVRYSGVLNFEYGYPLFNFAYPFPYYLGVFIHLFHNSFVSSIKILFALTVPLSALCMYLLSRKVWQNAIAGGISALIYAFLPYRFVDLYVRGSLGESLSFVLYPAILYFLSCVTEKRKSGVIGAGICLAILVMSHNIMSVFFMPILFVFMVLFYRKDKSLVKPFLTVFGLGITLPAFFWLPALAEKHTILLSKIPIADRSLYFVKPLALVLPSFGYGTPTDPHPFTYQIGLPHVILFLLVVLLIVISYLTKKKHNDRLVIAIGFVGLTLVLSVLLFSPFAFLWQLPLLKEINYPWTLLLPIGFLVCFLSGAVTLFKKPVVIAGIGISLLSVGFVSYAHPQSYVDRGDGFYLTNEATTTSSNELMPLWVKKLPFERPALPVQVIEGKGNIRLTTLKSQIVSFSATMIKPGRVRINRIYYPGWHITEDGKQIMPKYTNDLGVMDIPVTKGLHIFQAQFTDTPTRLFSDIISLIALGWLMVFIFTKGKGLL